MRLFVILLSLFPLNAHAATRQELYILRDELGIERQQLQNIVDELGQLRRQQRTLQRDLNVTLADRIRENNAEIQNLSELLQTQRSREAAIDRSTDSYLNQIIAASKANQEQIEYNVKDAERRQRQLQEQINFSPLYTVSAPMTADPARQTLQSEHKEQTQQLALLREQRQRQSLLQVEQIQQLNNDRAFQKNQLIEDLALLQESLSTLRAENARLESEKVQAELSLKGVEQQLTQQQQLRAAQERKVQALNSNLEKRSFE